MAAAAAAAGGIPNFGEYSSLIQIGANAVRPWNAELATGAFLREKAGAQKRSPTGPVRIDRTAVANNQPAIAVINRVVQLPSKKRLKHQFDSVWAAKGTSGERVILAQGDDPNEFMAIPGPERAFHPATPAGRASYKTELDALEHRWATARPVVYAVIL